jgi:flagellar L-ring protein precursor FlgH
MTRKDVLTMAAVGLGCGAGGLVRADSIWLRAQPDTAFLFVDSKARTVGDLITVVISETTAVDNKDDRSMNKATSASEGLSFSGEASGGLSGQSSAASLDFSNESQRDFQGGATFRSEREFIDRITVTVMDVLPNGNLVLSGKRRVWIAGEEVTLVVTGIARNIDIGPDNTVQSRFVSELRLNYESEGAPKAFTRQGRLGRMANRLWPF